MENNRDLNGIINPGDPLFVTRAERPMAISFGASMEPGDGRLRIPNPLPEEVNISVFARWVTVEARIRWVSEILENVVGLPFDASDLASFLITVSERDKKLSENEREVVPLFVSRGDMDRVRAMPGVRWDRKRRQYMADRTANFKILFDYLTPRAFCAWAIDRHADVATHAMVKAFAIDTARRKNDQNPTSPQGDLKQVAAERLMIDKIEKSSRKS